MARPTDYTAALAARICELVAGGRSERAIGRMAGMPDRTTIARWAAAHGEFGGQLAIAREERGEQLVEAALEEGLRLIREGRRGSKGLSKETVQARRAGIEVLFRRAAQLAPKKLGPLLRHAGADGEGPVGVLVVRREIVKAAEG